MRILGERSNRPPPRLGRLNCFFFSTSASVISHPFLFFSRMKKVAEWALLDKDHDSLIFWNEHKNSD